MLHFFHTLPFLCCTFLWSNLLMLPFSCCTLFMCCTISCCIFTHCRSSRPEVFFGKGVLKICSKFTGKHPCRNAISRNFIEIALRHGCSPVNLLHISRTPFPRNTSGWLLLEIGFFKILKFDRLLFRFKFISSLPLEIRRKFLANHFEFRVLHSTSVFLQCSIFFVWLLWNNTDFFRFYSTICSLLLFSSEGILILKLVIFHSDTCEL